MADDKAKKAKIDMPEDDFGQTSASSLPTVTGVVEYDHAKGPNGSLVFSVPLERFTYQDSRPTSNAKRRLFVVQGDLDRAGLPGSITGKGGAIPVTFTNPQCNIFFGPPKA